MKKETKVEAPAVETPEQKLERVTKQINAILAYEGFTMNVTQNVALVPKQ